MPVIREALLWLVLRCVLAILVSVHGWHRMLDDGVMPFARYMENRLPFGFYLVFVLQAMEMLGSVVFALGRFVPILGFIFSMIYACSIYFYHAQFGWFQSGGNQNGAEYAFVLLICFLASAIAALPSRETKPNIPLVRRWSSSQAEGSARSKLAWALVASTVVFVVLIHVLARIMNGSVDTISALMPEFISSPLARQALALFGTVLQACACLAIAFGRLRSPSFLTLAILFLLAIVFHHLQFGWIVSGADKDGAEFIFLMMALSLILAILHRQRG